MTFKRNGVQFDKWEYAYDKAGNISQVKRNGASLPPPITTMRWASW